MLRLCCPENEGRLESCRDGDVDRVMVEGEDDFVTLLCLLSIMRDVLTF